MAVVKSKWITEGCDIRCFTEYENLIYQNEIISTFLQDPNKYFIIAGKGIGKTLLLRYKRYLMNEKSDGVVFLPADRPYIDFVDRIAKTLSMSEIRQFSDVDFCTNFWRVTLQTCLLSAISISTDSMEKFLADITAISPPPANLAKHFRFLLGSKRGVETICNYLITHVGETNLVKLFDISYLITDLFRKEIKHSVVYFFDRLDQAFKYTDAEIWLSMQQGLLEAAWNIMKSNPHVKIYLSLRQEAYDAHSSFNKESMAANTSLISYTEQELYDLITQLVKFYEGKDSFKDFVGVEYINNNCHKKETVYQLLNRYSIGRPRDFVVFGKALSERVGDKYLSIEDRAQKLKEVIITSSSSNIISGLHDEVSMLLTCLKTKQRFDDFVKLLNRNVLTYFELQEYCKRFNGITTCSKECSDCKESSEMMHPFCDLYIMGLLGEIKREEDTLQMRQVFKSPYKDITKAGVSRESEYYLIHPALRRYIQALQTGKSSVYEIYEGSLIGDGLPWTDKDSVITKIHKEIDCLEEQNLKKILLQELIHFARMEEGKPFSELLSICRSINGKSDANDSQAVQRILRMLSKDKEEKISEEKISVFVSYAHGDDAHNNKVISFTNELRNMGFDAVMDASLKIDYPDIDAMMTEGLKRDKIIVVLSKKYKEKADNQKDGVWAEFKMIAADLEKNVKKYIFISFDALTNGLVEKILPTRIGRRQIVDLGKTKNDEERLNELVSYITDTVEY